MVGMSMLVSVLSTLIVLPAALMKFQPSFIRGARKPWIDRSRKIYLSETGLQAE